MRTAPGAVEQLSLSRAAEALFWSHVSSGVKQSRHTLGSCVAEVQSLFITDPDAVSAERCAGDQ